jgi:hypothetical protein
MSVANFQRKYLRNRPAAEYLGVSESFLNKRRVSGEPPTFLKIGKVVAYSLNELDRYLMTCRRKSTSDEPSIAERLAKCSTPASLPATTPPRRRRR